MSAPPRTREISSNDSWRLCPSCSWVLPRRKLDCTFGVCSHCGHYFPLSARERLAQLVDEGPVRILAPPVPADPDPLRFEDSAPYVARLAVAQQRSGQSCGVLSARAIIDGTPVVISCMEFTFLGGSLGTAEGSSIVQAATCAAEEQVPLVLISCSGGARMQEGAVALMQMARTAAALRTLHERGVLTISVITDPTYGGVAASFANLCDVTIAESGARCGFAGPRVIRETVQESLPAGFQSAESLMECGLLDHVVDRGALKAHISRLLRVTGALAPGNERADPTGLTPGPRTPASTADVEDPWATVRRARDIRRPTALDYCELAFDGFIELHGDRAGRDSGTVVGGFARLDGSPVMVIGTQKGHTGPELTARDFGMAQPSGYRKAMRLMGIAVRLGLPVVTLVDTPGAAPGVAAEQGGQAAAIAECIDRLLAIPVPVVSVIIGEGGSGGALALATGNIVLAFPSSTYSVISPEGCAAILWGRSGAAPEAARALRPDAPAMQRLGIIDALLHEPEGGPQESPAQAAHILRDAVARSLAEVRAWAPEELSARRRERFEQFGGSPICSPTSGR